MAIHESTVISSSDSCLSDTTELVRKKRRTRGPKQKLLSRPRDEKGYEHTVGSVDNTQLIMLGNMTENKRSDLYQELREGLLKFLRQPLNDWDSKEEIRKFNIFGDIITCVQWEGQHYISGNDAIKVQLGLYRLHFGRLPSDRRKFEEGVYSDLRQARLGSDGILEQANSKFLRYLYSIGCVKTHKRQKIFYWRSVRHLDIHEEVIRREIRKSISAVGPVEAAVKKNAFGNLPIAPNTREEKDDGSNRKRRYSLPLLERSSEGSPTSWGTGNSRLSSPPYEGAAMAMLMMDEATFARNVSPSNKQQCQIKYLYMPYQPAPLTPPKSVVAPDIMNLVYAIDALDSGEWSSATSTCANNSDDVSSNTSQLSSPESKELNRLPKISQKSPPVEEKLPEFKSTFPKCYVGFERS